jgi:GNAT superfamily N-acetyltransferase
VTVDPGLAVREALTYRPVRPDELELCTEVWRESINDYTRRLNLPDLQAEVGPLLRLYTHLQATDPERFVVATQPNGAGTARGERIVAFAAALQRERLWFLSMCFVRPHIQAAGVGRRLLAEVGPRSIDGDTDGETDGASGERTVRATATDSAQPISNALYASVGMVPKVPLLNLIGLPERPDAFGVLPSGLRPVPFEVLAREDHERLAATVDALDRETLGVAHPIDHAYLRAESRHGWLYIGPDDAVLAYGYATEAGRIGPVASRDADLLVPILGHLSSAVIPRGAFATWLPGAADRAVVATLQAGFRLEPFPILLCWDRPFADLSRYLPISPGLL